MRILGVDPGSLKTGFGLIDIQGEQLVHVNHGVIVLADEATFAHRLLALGESLQMLIQQHQPQRVIVEKIFLGKNPESAFQLGHARGVVLCEAIRAGCQLQEFATRAVKKGVAGSGAASKDDVQLALKTLLGLKSMVNTDASDALALAYFGAMAYFEELKTAQLIDNKRIAK